MTTTPTILVTEDEGLMRETLAAGLAGLGLNVVEASNAEEALEALKAHPEIDVLMTDVTMPGRLNGCDLAREVHEKWPWVRVVVTSGKLLPENCHLPDGDVFLPKPYRLDAVAGVISELLL